MKLLKHAIVIPLLFPIYANAQNANWQSQVWEGKIGNLEIVLEAQRTLDEKGKPKFAAHYFYKKHRKIINLFPMESGREYQETYYDCLLGADEHCTPFGKISFDKKGDFSKGVWSDTKGKKNFLVELKKVSQTEFAKDEEPKKFENFYNAYGLKQESVFYQKLVSGPYNDSKPSYFGNNAVIYRTEKTTQNTYPRIHSFQNPAVKTKINATLEAFQEQMIGDAIECASMSNQYPGQGGYAGYEDYRADVKILNSRFMVIEESSSLFCGGAHPNNMWYRLTYDMTDGSEFDFSKYFKIYDTPQDKADRKYNANFTAFIESLKPQSKYLTIKNDEYARECLADDIGFSYSLSLNEKGVVFSLADLPHVMGACMGEYFVVPYKDMKRFMTPKGLKFFAPELK